MPSDAEIVRQLLVDMVDDLEDVQSVSDVEGYAAEDEIGDAIDHLEAAIVDLGLVDNDSD